MKKRLFLTMVFMVTVIFVLAACTGNVSDSNGTIDPADNAEPEEVTLTFYSGTGKVLEALNAEELIKTALPHITLNVINNQEGQRYEDLIASGTLPDIIYAANSTMISTIIRHGFEYDISDLIKKHNFNLDVFEPNVLMQAKASNPQGKLYGLPYQLNLYALVYNKDLFDRFGAEYPKDGMTWDDVYQLAANLTRVEDGIQYQGFSMSTPGSYFLNNQIGAQYLHPTKNEPNIQTDAYRLLFDNLSRFYQIENSSLQNANFLNGDLVMQVRATSAAFFKQVDEAGMNWNMASVPVLKDYPDTGFKPAGLSMFITQTSKHKDAAFDVVEYLVSEAYQTLLVRSGTGTPLLSDAVRSQHGKDIPGMDDINMQALYYHPFAQTPPARPENLVDVSVNLTTAFNEMIETQTDVNTTLLKLSEEIQAKINEALASQ